MLRLYSSRVCVVSDYKKNDGKPIHQHTTIIDNGHVASDLELAYWFADEAISCSLCRLVRTRICFRNM
jgi:hypothetical protein